MEQIESRTIVVSGEVFVPDIRQLTFRDGQRGAPLVSQYVQTDAAVGVDVWMVDSSGEVDFGWLERVVGREVDG
jgi:hypothetical protein